MDGRNNRPGIGRTGSLWQLPVLVFVCFLKAEYIPSFK
jgi:hypothetical protein